MCIVCVQSRAFVPVGLPRIIGGRDLYVSETSDSQSVKDFFDDQIEVDGVYFKFHYCRNVYYSMTISIAGIMIEVFNARCVKHLLADRSTTYYCGKFSR